MHIGLEFRPYLSLDVSGLDTSLGIGRSANADEERFGDEKFGSGYPGLKETFGSINGRGSRTKRMSNSRIWFGCASGRLRLSREGR
jgi:hypothetical protein